MDRAPRVTGYIWNVHETFAGHQSLGTGPEHGPSLVYSGATGIGTCLQVPMLRESYCSARTGCLGQEMPSSEYREGLNFYDLGAQ